MKGIRFAAFGLAAVVAAVIGTGAEAQLSFGSNKKKKEEEPKPVSPMQKQDKIFPVGTTWTAVDLNGKPFPGERPSFTVDQQFRAKGFGGCNTFSATAYPLRDQRLAVGPFAMTKRSCDKALMA